jgi:hypothetical protein
MLFARLALDMDQYEYDALSFFARATRRQDGRYSLVSTVAVSTDLDDLRTQSASRGKD